MMANTSFASTQLIAPSNTGMQPKVCLTCADETSNKSTETWHRERAAQLMIQARAEVGNHDTSRIFTYKEAQRSLTTIIADRTNPPATALVNVLLEYGASPNIARRKSKNLFKRLLRRDQENRRSHLLADATLNDICSTAVVQILAMQADDEAKDEALRSSFLQANMAKVRVLVAAGADASTFCDQFQSAAQSDDEDMVEAFLTAPRGPCQDCRDQAMIIAASHGSVRNAQALALGGADLDFQNGAALCKATESGSAQLVAAVASSNRRPSPSTLDLAVRTALTALCGKPHDLSQILKTLTGGDTKPSLNAMVEVLNYAIDLGNGPTTYEITDTILVAGLRGDAIANALVKVISSYTSRGVDSELQHLTNLLLQKGSADVNWADGKPLVLTVMQGKHELLALLLRYGPSVDSLNAALTLTMQNVTGPLRLSMVTEILQSGAKGSPVDQMLCMAAGLGTDGLPLTSVLLRHSSVDSDGGRSLVLAARSRCLEQMGELMRAEPSEYTIAAAWAEIDSIDHVDFQLQAYRMLGDEVDESVKDRSLNAAVERGPSGHPVCKFLLEHQASPERLGGLSIVTATRRLDIDTLRLLHPAVASPAPFSAALDALSGADGWFNSSCIEVLDFLLDCEPSSSALDRAFSRAASLLQLEALGRLATSIEDANSVNKAFTAAIKADVNKSGKLEVVDFLLHECGASGDCVDDGLIHVVDAHVKGIDSESLIDTLLAGEQKANVNHANAAALRIVAASGDAALLKKVASHGASTDSLSLIFASVIGNEKLSEKAATTLIDVVRTNEGAKLDVNTTPPAFPPALIGCLKAHPKSVALLKHLIELGCRLDAEYPTAVDPSDVSPEDVSVLMWALCQPVQDIDSKVIKALIKAKADVSFTSQRTGTTPLILAARSGRSNIVDELLRSRAYVLHKDKSEKSALFYASAAGHVESAKALVKAGATLSDGSLHEAARNLHSEVVDVLLKGKHKPDFPSSIHQGRSALQEMALNCDGKGDIVKMEATIVALVQGKANPMKRWRHQNALFLALNNAHPIAITKAIIDRAMWEHIDDESNVIEVSDTDIKNAPHYFLSPTVYLYRGYAAQTATYAQVTELCTLLKDKGCVDRFYAEKNATQPPDAIGLPAEIAAIEEKREAERQKKSQKEAEHMAKLRHEQQLAEQREAIEQQKHLSMLHRGQLTHQQSGLHLQQTAAQKQEIMTMNSKQKNYLDLVEHSQKQITIEEQARLKLQAKIISDQQQQWAITQQLQTKAQFADNSMQQKISLQQTKNQLAAEAASEKDRFAQRAVQRKLGHQKRENKEELRNMESTGKLQQADHRRKMELIHAKRENMKVQAVNRR